MGGVMNFRKFNKTYFIRIDKDEEIISSLKTFCEQNNIKVGSIKGIGAAKKAIIGLFDPVKKEYYSTHLEGDFEITSMLGNITTMDDKVYLHIHINLADKEHKTYGGHLNKALVSATCEIVLEVLDGKLERYFDKEIGLNLLDFSKE
jgi:predicted DNA-binding protein with PD1-like motif